MNKIRIEIGNKTIVRDIPSNWNELTKRQVLFVAPIVFTSPASIESLREIAIHCLALPSNVYKLMNLSQLDDIANSFTFLWESNTLTNQVIPFVRSNPFRILHGPATSLQNTTAAEWAFADRFLNSFLKMKDEKT